MNEYNKAYQKIKSMNPNLSPFEINDKIRARLNLSTLKTIRINAINGTYMGNGMYMYDLPASMMR